MALKTSSANRKDINTAARGVSLEHRHFSFIAAALASTKPESDGPELNQWNNMVLQFASDCRASNPRFDRARFLAACGA